MPSQVSEKASQISPSSQSSFENLGSSLHFKINDHHDLEAVLDLDEALWVATTAPVSTLNADPVFLQLLDTDLDKRLRAEEIKDGIRFLLQYLADPSGIRAENFSLLLAAIDTTKELGARIHSSALKILKRLNVTSESIELDQVRSVQKEVQKGGLDQAGIVLLEATEGTEISQFVADIIHTVGGKQHPNGKTGVDAESLADFMEESRRYLNWRLEAGDAMAGVVTTVLPLGKNTADGYALFHSLAKKLVQYFLLCDIKRLNPDLLSRALATPEGNVAVNLIDVERAESYLENAPLGRLDTEGVLDLRGEINPYFQNKIRALADRVIAPLLGPDVTAIDKYSFRKLQDIFKPFVEWTDKKPEVRVDAIDSESIERYVNDASYRKSLEALIDESHRTAFVLDNIRELERLLLYQAYMLPLVNSFVSCPMLYDMQRRAMFEEGTLVMDGRHFALAVKVEDRERHIDISKGSNIFVLYCQLFTSDGKIACEVAVPVTSGNRGHLRLNKWGIFNDVDNSELHAKVVDIVENPISVTEAMVDPFIRISRAFFSRLEEFSSKAEERLFRKQEKAKDNKKKDVSSGGLLAGGGVAVAALGSSFAFVTKTLAGLSVKTIVLALSVVSVLIAVPAGISAYYRLSRRDLSTILEGSGWGMNTRMKLTRKQANWFTYRPDPRSGKTTGQM
jgi:hypothetical protein